MSRKILSLLSLLTFCVAAIAEPVVKVSYVDLSEVEISSQPVKEYVQPELLPKFKHPMVIYPSIRFQQIVGLGGCFNEIGGQALSVLSEEAQSGILNSLFDPQSPSAFTFCRMAIGASDFGIDAYSFSEVAEDYKMRHFSLERDRDYMLPYIQKALAVNPEIELFGSPWSPPGWMKESGYMDRGIEFQDKNVLRDDPKIYEAYALYFAKYVEAYAKEGVDVSRILIQNEQDFHTKYPSCRMPVEQMSKFVGEYMRPLFDKRKIETEIWGGTFRTADEADGLNFAANERYNKNFDGAGLQYTSPQYIHDMMLLAPGLKLMHTESNCFNGLNNIKQSATRFSEVASYINGGSENFCYWNMILNETGKSGWDWRQNTLITINRETKQVTYNPDYAAMKLLSQFIKRGSVRIGSFSRHTLISTERDGLYYLVVQNDLDREICYSCDIEGEKIEFAVPANALCGIEISL